MEKVSFVTLSTCKSQIDTHLLIYNLFDYFSNNFPISYNNDNGNCSVNPFGSLISLKLFPDEYFILISGNDNLTQGDYELSIECGK